jgi:hypothetical protein
MTIEAPLRDVIYIISLIVSIVVMWSKLGAKVDKQNDKIERFEKKMYTNEGKFDLIDKETCLLYRIEQAKKIDKVDSSYNELVEKLQTMHSDIIVIKTRMNGHENPIVTMKKEKKYV